MQPIKNYQSCLKERSLLLPTKVSIDVGLLTKNHHKINLIGSEGFLINKGVVPFCGSHLTPPCLRGYILD